ncbi:FlgD immunoglobulin-like domain containing protein [Nocardioides acrostichi]|uniref:FlgD/Vpr Ig-like domain-containing protein n=1 Tax=Nocardioides acrostichi TaxID=2784339 RepID=A0A930V3I0_9ACTN|nr:FlgD immunoglobulin-like domain containing protein [Nocardioides acrostichi]MBF4162544.1 hypothetical protein [Nocardioides acrostichi]
MSLPRRTRARLFAGALVAGLTLSQGFAVAHGEDVAPTDSPTTTEPAVSPAVDATDAASDVASDASSDAATATAESSGTPTRPAAASSSSSAAASDAPATPTQAPRETSAPADPTSTAPTSSASTPAGVMTVTSPVLDSTTDGDFAGPVELSGVTAGHYDIAITRDLGCVALPGTSPCETTASVDVPAGTDSVEVPLATGLGRDGAYTVSVTGAASTTSHFTIAGATNDDLGWVSVDSPSEGAFVPTGTATVPVTIGFNDLPSTAPQTFTLETTLPSRKVVRSTVTPSEPQVDLPSRRGPYHLRVLDSDGVLYAVSSFVVSDQPLMSGLVSTTGPAFYPLVHDGYLDAVRLRAYLNAPAALGWVVYDHSGQPVRVERAGDVSSSARQFVRWNGRLATGKMAAPGRYTLSVTATGTDGRQDTRTVPVRVRTGHRTVTRHIEVQGSAPDTRANHGCSVSKQGGLGLVVDCTQPDTSACFTYDVKLPAGATAGRVLRSRWRWDSTWRGMDEMWTQKSARRATYAVCVDGPGKYSIDYLRWQYTLRKQV